MQNMPELATTIAVWRIELALMTGTAFVCIWGLTLWHHCLFSMILGRYDRSQGLNVPCAVEASWALISLAGLLLCSARMIRIGGILPVDKWWADVFFSAGMCGFGSAVVLAVCTTRAYKVSINVRPSLVFRLHCIVMAMFGGVAFLGKTIH